MLGGGIVIKVGDELVGVIGAAVRRQLLAKHFLISTMPERVYLGMDPGPRLR